MGILQLLAKENYITYHKVLAKIVGVDEAILFGELCSMSNLYGEEFFCEQNKLINDTGLTEYRIRNALKNLQKADLVSFIKKGLPAKNWYILNEKRLLELLDLHRTSGVKFDTTGDSNFNGACDNNFDSTFNKNTNNKNTENKNTDNIEGENPKRKRFMPPSLEEVKEYCSERNNSIDPQRFIDYYTANGWLVGKNKMKDWKAAVRNWERNGYSDKKQGNENRSYDTDDFFNAALKKSYGARAGLEREVVSRAEENAKNPPKTAADDEEIRERMERLKERLGNNEPF